MATNGLRTERVVLEVTHDYLSHASAMDWPYMVANYFHRNGESVRVVEEAAIDPGWAERLEADRDAAIRERDTHKEEYYKLRGERITQALTADRFAAAVAENDRLKARVAELESAAKLAPAANADGGSNHAAPAASGAAGTEVVAWEYSILTDHGMGRGVTLVPPSTIAWACIHEADPASCVPLYAAPQPAPGWLTAEERSMLQNAASTCRVEAKHSARSGDERAASDYESEAIAIDLILARSSPPEVVRPGPWQIAPEFLALGVNWKQFIHDCNKNRDAEWHAALAAAGVTVKEVRK